MYNENKLEQLNLELKDYVDNFGNIDLSFVNLKNKRFEINGNKLKKFTLYEYCILTRKYINIQKMCQYLLKSS